jgi:L-ascorbate metabolism protein UlaG (beta-lactamase superfamily)
MNATVTYIHHNCFLLEYGLRTFLFDYPAPSHLPAEAAAAAKRLIQGKDLVIMISHSHEDHFDPAILAATSNAASRRFVVSDDVPDMFPDALPDASDTVCVMEPEEQREFAGLVIETLESNDLGVAYLVTDGPVTFYFGGDLANWNWETLPPVALQAAEDFFHQALNHLKSRDIAVAFSNVDRRLKSLAGGIEFLETVRPRLFVPTHAFGDASWLKDYEKALETDGGAVFFYEKPGDSIEIEL